MTIQPPNPPLGSPLRRRVWVALLLLPIAGGPAVRAQRASTLPPAVRAERLRQNAEDLQRQGKFAEAAKALSQAAELQPRDWEIWDALGWAQLDIGNAAEAKKAFEKAAAEAPRGASLSAGPVVAAFALKDLPDLESRLRKTAPPEVLDEVLQAVRKGLAAAPRSPDWSYALAVLYVKGLGNRQRALGPAEAVVAAQPGRADAWLLLVDINQELGRGPQEDAAAVKYLELAPETADAFRLRAQRYEELNRVGEAAAELSIGLGKHPTSLDLAGRLSRLQEKAGLLKEAEATLRKTVAASATRSDSVSAQARLLLAGFLVRTGKTPDAVVLYRELADRAGSGPVAWSNLGAALALDQKWAESAGAHVTAFQRESSERSESVRENRSQVQSAALRAGIALLAAGNRAEAEKHWKQALDPEPKERTQVGMEAAAFLAWLGNADARASLAYAAGDERWAGFVWRRTAEPGEVEARGNHSLPARGLRAALQSIQSRTPDCWPADLSLARQYAAAGYTDEALALLRKTARVRSDWWAPLYPMGQYYARERKKDEGIEILQQCSRLAPASRQVRSLLSLLKALPDPDPE